MRRITPLLATLLLAATAAAQETSSRALAVSTQAPTTEAPPPPAAPKGITVIDAYQDGGSTKFVLQSPQPLVVGQPVYAGPAETLITVGEMLSRKGGIYLYPASVPGWSAVKAGDAVLVEKTVRGGVPEAVARSLRAAGGVEQKEVAEITAVQGDRLIIDKGTLNEVHERDLYRIIDASGTFKGFLEVRGIGDTQSSAVFSKVGWTYKKTPPPVPGDYGVFLGQRRLFGLGVVAGAAQRKQILHAFDETKGGGLLWSLTFYDGWGVEALFGRYERTGADSTKQDLDLAINRIFTRDFRKAHYLMPIWVKKSFRYPKRISPFVAAGGYWFTGEHSHELELPGERPVAEKRMRHGLYPTAGFGVEFFPARFIRPRVEVRHFWGPDLVARGNIFRTDSTFYSIGLLTSW